MVKSILELLRKIDFRKRLGFLSNVSNYLYCFLSLTVNKGSINKFIRLSFRNIGSLSSRLIENECTIDHIDGK